MLSTSVPSGSREFDPYHLCCLLPVPDFCLAFGHGWGIAAFEVPPLLIGNGMEQWARAASFVSAYCGEKYDAYLFVEYDGNAKCYEGNYL